MPEEGAETCEDSHQAKLIEQVVLVTAELTRLALFVDHEDDLGEAVGKEEEDDGIASAEQELEQDKVRWAVQSHDSTAVDLCFGLLDWFKLLTFATLMSIFSHIRLTMTSSSIRQLGILRILGSLDVNARLVKAILKNLWIWIRQVTDFLHLLQGCFLSLLTRLGMQ